VKNIHNIVGSPPSSEKIYEKLFDFLDSVLPVFSILNTNNDGKLVSSENAITEDLTDFLDNKQEELNQDPNVSFRFTYQSGGKTDIGIKFGRGFNASNRKLICWIEAKRLPTPNGKSKRDEREYVFVDKKVFKGNGGIQRFKESKHAPELSSSIMIGYIQDKNEIDYWLSKINVWIKELAKESNGFWGNEDCLIKYFPSKCDRFLSKHKRRDGTMIVLHHYWKIL
jgi:hypothetical protein